MQSTVTHKNGLFYCREIEKATKDSRRLTSLNGPIMVAYTMPADYKIKHNYRASYLDFLCLKRTVTGNILKNWKLPQKSILKNCSWKLIYNYRIRLYFTQY